MCFPDVLCALDLSKNNETQCAGTASRSNELFMIWVSCRMFICLSALNKSFGGVSTFICQLNIISLRKNRQTFRQTVGFHSPPGQTGENNHRNRYHRWLLLLVLWSTCFQRAGEIRSLIANLRRSLASDRTSLAAIIGVRVFDR